MTKNKQVDEKKRRERAEQSFDEHYNKIIASQEIIERLTIVSKQLEKRYEDYAETKEFIRFLCSIEEVFAQAEKKKWSVEKTQDEMIKGEIYLMSQTTGIDEIVFNKIYEEFQNASNNVGKIQSIANDLIEKYTDDADCQPCKEFIMYIRDSLLVFLRALDGDIAFDEVDEAKEEIIRLRMEIMAVDNHPPFAMLQKIYDDFLELLHAE